MCFMVQTCLPVLIHFLSGHIEMDRRREDDRQSADSFPCL